MRMINFLYSLQNARVKPKSAHVVRTLSQSFDGSPIHRRPKTAINRSTTPDLIDRQQMFRRAPSPEVTFEQDFVEPEEIST